METKEKEAIENPRDFDSRRFFKRLFELVRTPTEAWAQISSRDSQENDSQNSASVDASVDVGEARDFLHYYLPAVILWLTGTISGSLFFGVHYPVEDPVTSEFVFKHLYPEKLILVAQQVLIAFFYILLPFLFAKPMLALTRYLSSGETQASLSDSRRLILFSYAPSVAASAFQAIPMLSLLSVVVSIQGFFLFQKGITPMLGLEERSKRILFVVSLMVFITTSILVVLGIHLTVGNPYQEAALS